jgi:hypothetical protein
MSCGSYSQCRQTLRKLLNAELTENSLANFRFGMVKDSETICGQTVLRTLRKSQFSSGFCKYLSFLVQLSIFVPQRSRPTVDEKVRSSGKYFRNLYEVITAADGGET